MSWEKKNVYTSIGSKIDFVKDMQYEYAIYQIYLLLLYVGANAVTSS